MWKEVSGCQDYDSIPKGVPIKVKYKNNDYPNFIEIVYVIDNGECFRYIDDTFVIWSIRYWKRIKGNYIVMKYSPKDPDMKVALKELEKI